MCSRIDTNVVTETNCAQGIQNAVISEMTIIANNKIPWNRNLYCSGERTSLSYLCSKDAKKEGPAKGKN